MSLLAVLRKSGETIASYDVPNHNNDLTSLRESMHILQQEVNQTITSLLDGVESPNSESGDDEMGNEDSDEDENGSMNGVKRKSTETDIRKRIRMM